jgi:hypothetical protein
MAKIPLTNIVLPTPVEFLRWITRTELDNQKALKDTSVTVLPIVSKAQSLTSKQGLIITTYVKDTGNG